MYQESFVSGKRCTRAEAYYYSDADVFPTSWSGPPLPVFTAQQGWAQAAGLPASRQNQPGHRCSPKLAT